MHLLNKNFALFGNLINKSLFTKVSDYIKKGDQFIHIPIREMEVPAFQTLYESVLTADTLKHLVYGRGGDDRLVIGYVIDMHNDSVNVLYSRNGTVDRIRNEPVTHENFYITTIQLTSSHCVPVAVSPDYRYINWCSLTELEPCTLEHYTAWSRLGGAKWAGYGYDKLDLVALKGYLNGDTNITVEECLCNYTLSPDLFFDIAPGKKPTHYLSLGNEKWEPEFVTKQELIDMFDFEPKLKASVFKSFKIHTQF